MKKYIFLVVLLSMAIVAIPAHANYFCSGTVTSLGLGTDGTVWVGGPGGIPVDVLLCNVNTTTPNGFTAETCKKAYAALLAARLSGQSVSIDFSDNLTCSTQPAWGPYVSVYFISNP